MISFLPKTKQEEDFILNRLKLQNFIKTSSQILSFLKFSQIIFSSGRISNDLIADDVSIQVEQDELF